VFVPSGAFVSWHASFEHPDGVRGPLPHTLLSSGSPVVVPPHLRDQQPVVLEHCFVDASNLNRVISSLNTHALLNDADYDLLTLLQSSHLDITMSRRPEPLTWRDFAIWPRSDSVGSATDSAGAMADPENATRAVKRNNRASRLKDWQEDRKWVLRVRWCASAHVHVSASQECPQHFALCPLALAFIGVLTLVLAVLVDLVVPSLFHSLPYRPSPSLSRWWRRSSS
jgi:hypothetical protein